MKLDWKTIQAAIYQLIEEYKFDPHQILDIVKMWVKTAFKKDYLDAEKKVSLEVNIDKDGNIKVYREYNVVETVEDENIEMTVKDGKKHMSDVKVWDTILIDITPSELEFSRIAVQAAAQTIKQNLKKIERERFFEKFQNKQWEILKAKVLKVIQDNVVLDVEWTTVILAPEGQIPNRVYNPWEEVYVLLRQISKWVWGIVLDISQSSPDFVEVILRNYVPELREWKVKITKIVRVAWKRTKVLVSTDDERVDPVGTFVGQHWDRISSILSTLDWEKIDFIEYHQDPAILISSCLKPARIISIDIKGKKAIVEVADDQKALAIWKWAVNIKLASQLSGYTIEIQ